MNWHSDLHQQYVLDRQQRLLADAAANRLAGAVPARTRILHLLGRSPVEPARPCPPISRPLAAVLNLGPCE